MLIKITCGDEDIDFTLICRVVAYRDLTEKTEGWENEIIGGKHWYLDVNGFENFFTGETVARAHISEFIGSKDKFKKKGFLLLEVSEGGSYEFDLYSMERVEDFPLL